MRRGKKFRVGQRVQLASDPTHAFVIDKSLVPERIYREKGSHLWWTKNELQRLGEPENPATSIRLNGKTKCAQNAPKCAQVVSGGPFPADSPVYELKQRKCLECGVSFQPARDWQQFHSTQCRRAYWKRTRKSQARLRVEAKEPKLLADTPCDTMATVN